MVDQDSPAWRTFQNEHFEEMAVVVEKDVPIPRREADVSGSSSPDAQVQRFFSAIGADCSQPRRCPPRSGVRGEGSAAVRRRMRQALLRSVQPVC